MKNNRHHNDEPSPAGAQTMTRREFLKTIGRLLTAGAALYFGAVLHPLRDNRSRRQPGRRARFYRRADHLAG